MHALILTGAERYADPWHPFPKTTTAITEILEECGFTVDVECDVDQGMQRLKSIDLVVVNAGDPWRDPKSSVTPPAQSIDGFSVALDRGIGVLAMHCAVSSLRDYPEWFPAIGGMWIPGVSFHPPATDLRVTPCSGGPLEDTDAFTLFDEAYCRIQPIGRSKIVATFDGPAGREPAAWIRHVGHSRVAVNLLGHDERSFTAAGHQAMLQTLARWATEAQSAAEMSGPRSEVTS